MEEKYMKKDTGRNRVAVGALLVALFALWTVLIRTVDVQPIGQQGTDVGFAGLNGWFHRLTGVHMGLYTATDLLSVIPFLVCAAFGVIGLVQLIRRRSLWKVDADILLLGVYYVVVILAYLLFEKLHLNYRPVLIEGQLEASYPSSTTLLVLAVMPTLAFQAGRRMKPSFLRTAVQAAAILFAVFMAAGRAVSGVHWLTDIVGGVLLSMGLYLLYVGAAALAESRRK